MVFKEFFCIDSWWSAKTCLQVNSVMFGICIMFIFRKLGRSSILIKNKQTKFEFLKSWEMYVNSLISGGWLVLAWLAHVGLVFSTKRNFHILLSYTIFNLIITDGDAILTDKTRMYQVVSCQDTSLTGVRGVIILQQILCSGFLPLSDPSEGDDFGLFSRCFYYQVFCQGWRPWFILCFWLIDEPLINIKHALLLVEGNQLLPAVQLA